MPKPPKKDPRVYLLNTLELAELGNFLHVLDLFIIIFSYSIIICFPNNCDYVLLNFS